jgi:hypothetical protein
MSFRVKELLGWTDVCEKKAKAMNCVSIERTSSKEKGTSLRKVKNIPELPRPGLVQWMPDEGATLNEWSFWGRRA